MSSHLHRPEALVAAAAAGVLVFAGARALVHRSYRDYYIVEIDITDDSMQYVECSSLDPLSELLYASNMMPFRSLLQLVLTAARSPLVGGFVLLSNGGRPCRLHRAQAAELAAALCVARANQKRVIAYVDDAAVSFWQTFPLLCTAADEIHMAPTGALGVMGISTVSPFVRRALDWLHIEPHLRARREHKTAANLFTHESFTPAHEAQVRALTDALQRLLTTAVVAGRASRLDATKVDTLVSDGPYTSADAQRIGLIDGVCHRDAFFATVLPRVFGAADAATLERRLLSLHAFSALRGTRRALLWSAPLNRGLPFSRRTVTRVALVTAAGTIHDGTSGSPPTQSAGAVTICDALRRAREDTSIDVVLLRIDSGGGSATASDAIHREVSLTVAVKPVVVCMSSVAASGGYYIAAPATRIVAHALCITGSIGIVAGKLNVRGFMADRLGVTVDTYETADNSALFNVTAGLSANNAERLDRVWTDNLYERFKTLVAEGRGLTAETVEEIAQGKVYVADEALKIGLIDRIGGFNEALAECRKAAAALRRAKATTKAAPAPAAAPVAAPAAAADVPPAAGRSLAVDAEEDCDASHENTVLVPFPVQSLWQLLSGNRPRNSRANPSPSLSAAVAAAPAVVASAAAAAALGPRRAALLRRVDGVVRAATDDGAVGAALGAVEAACTAQGVAVASLDESFHGTV